MFRRQCSSLTSKTSIMLPWMLIKIVIAILTQMVWSIQNCDQIDFVGYNPSWTNSMIIFWIMIMILMLIMINGFTLKTYEYFKKLSKNLAIIPSQLRRHFLKNNFKKTRANIWQDICERKLNRLRRIKYLNGMNLMFQNVNQFMKMPFRTVLMINVQIGVIGGNQNALKNVE